MQIVVLTASCGTYSFFSWSGAVGAAAFVTLRLFGLFMKEGHGVGGLFKKAFLGLGCMGLAISVQLVLPFFYQDVVD